MLKNTDAVVNAVKYTVRSLRTWQAFVDENDITRDQIAETAKAVAALAYPETDKAPHVQTKTVDGRKVRTDYGNAVQAAAAMLRKVLVEEDDDDTPKDSVLRVSLSGEGGGSTVVPKDHPLYASIVALLAS